MDLRLEQRPLNPYPIFYDLQHGFHTFNRHYIIAKASFWDTPFTMHDGAHGSKYWLFVFYDKHAWHT